MDFEIPEERSLVDLVDEIRADVRFMRQVVQIVVVLWLVALIGGLVAAVLAAQQG